jgi:hypothetical protein
MRTRYFLNLSLAAGATFLVVASQAFALIDIDNVTLGVGIGLLLLSIALGARHRKHMPSLALGGISAVISAWMIIASQVLSLPTVQDMTLACSLAIAGLAAVGLTVHELTTERVVHALQPMQARERDDSRALHESLVS